MKKTRCMIVIAAWLMVIAAGCGHGSRNRAQSQPGDTLYTVEAAMDIYGSNPRRALEIIDSGEVRGNITPFLASLMRARVYTHPSEISNCDTARQICVTLLDTDAARGDLNVKFDVLDQLKTIAYEQGDDEDLIKWATQLVEVCRKQNDEVEALRNEAEIGYTFTRVGHREAGLQKLDRVISALEGKHRFGENDACIVAMKRKLRALIDGGDMADAVPLAELMIAKIDDYEQHAAEYADGSLRDVGVDRVEDYCDFYRSQALAQAAYASASMGNMKAAADYLDRFEHTRYSHTQKGQQSIVPTWMLTGDYVKVLGVYDIVQQRMGSDTVNAAYAQMLKDRAIIAGNQGQYVTSRNYWNRFAHVSKLLTDEQLASRATSYAARYHAQEQQMEIQRQQAAMSRLIIVGVVLAIALALAIFFVIYFRRQRSMVKDKNRALTEQINEAIEYKQKYEDLLAEQAAQNPEPEEEQPAVPPVVKFSAMTPEELFRYLSTVIEREQLFLSPMFGRDALAERFHLSYVQIGAAFAQGSRYNSLPDFVRECRLNYACRLLHDHPEMNISEVAAASGFTSLSVFGRDFKQKYTLSPSAYRNKE